MADWNETELLEALRGEGLQDAADEANARMAAAEAASMNTTGPYQVLRTLTGSGATAGITVTIEQNTGSEPGPYGAMTVPYPPAVIVEGPAGQRCAASPADPEAVLALIRDFTGSRD
jgi:hypothetical protein